MTALVRPEGCICTNECDEVPEQNPCAYCRGLDIYEPCPITGFGCGSVDDSCDCCTPQQKAAAAGDAPDEWVADLPPGGYVCSVCKTPVESEPCPEHQPRAYSRIDA